MVRFPDGTQIMGNAKDVPHAMAWFKRVGDSYGTRRIIKEDAAQTAVGEDGKDPSSSTDPYLNMNKDQLVSVAHLLLKQNEEKEKRNEEIMEKLNSIHDKLDKADARHRQTPIVLPN